MGAEKGTLIFTYLFLASTICAQVDKQFSRPLPRLRRCIPSLWISYLLAGVEMAVILGTCLRTCQGPSNFPRFHVLTFSAKRVYVDFLLTTFTTTRIYTYFLSLGVHSIVKFIFRISVITARCKF